MLNRPQNRAALRLRTPPREPELRFSATVFIPQIPLKFLHRTMPRGDETSFTCEVTGRGTVANTKSNRLEDLSNGIKERTRNHFWLSRLPPGCWRSRAWRIRKILCSRRLTSRPLSRWPIHPPPRVRRRPLMVEQPTRRRKAARGTPNLAARTRNVVFSSGARVARTSAQPPSCHYDGRQAPRQSELDAVAQMSRARMA